MGKEASGRFDIDNLSTEEKLALLERLARSLRSPPPSGQAGKKRESLDRLRREVLALPVQSAAGGFLNRSHDAILYGKRR